MYEKCPDLDWDGNFWINWRPTFAVLLCISSAVDLPAKYQYRRDAGKKDVGCTRDALCRGVEPRFRAASE